MVGVRVAIAAALALSAAPAVPAWSQQGNGTCFGAEPTIVGTRDDDTLRGTDGDDVIDGRGGSDRISGLEGNDLICGGSGAGEVDVFEGGEGKDRVRGMSGDFSTADGGPGADILIASEGGMRGGGGNDRLLQRRGSIEFDQRIQGNAGNDRLVGGRGANMLDGGPGDDVLDGGDSFDTVVYNAAPRGVTVDLGERVASGWGRDRLIAVEAVGGSQLDDVLKGDDGDNTLMGRRGEDRLVGNGGHDHLVGRNDADVLLGGLGEDWVEGEGGWDPAPDGEGGGEYIGPGGPDVIRGGGGKDRLDGWKGSDDMSGGRGPDFFFGEDGWDSMKGGPGDDYMLGGIGRNAFNGGPGRDSADFFPKHTLRVSLKRGRATSSADPDTLVGIEIVYGSDGADVLIGDAGDNELHGRGTQNAKDRLMGKDGDDVLVVKFDDLAPNKGGVADGGLGRDTISFEESFVGVIADLAEERATIRKSTWELLSFEWVVGSLADDRLLGDGGRNSLRAGPGDDYLNGRGSRDLLGGGKGRDRCVKGEELTDCERD